MSTGRNHGKMGNDFVDYELVGGGPMDGKVGHMYWPAPEVRFLCKHTDVYYAAANMPTYTDLYHVYRLSRGTNDKLFYKYEGYST